jgi:O-antigen/teichoic acid export membrane protein
MTLREHVLRGGFYLVLRQGLGLVISIGGIILLTRLIGPANYGLYAGSLVLLIFLSNVARMGVDVYLVRQEGTPDRSVYHQAFSFLLLSGLAMVALGFLVSPLLVEYWLKDPRFLAPLQTLLLSLPLVVLAVPAVASIERALDYRKIAIIELTGQFLQYSTALFLAWRGFGFWAPVAGFFLFQAWTVASSYALTRYVPRWHWSPQLVRQMLGYGMGYSSSIWVWQLRELVNPLIVGRFLGPEGVGYVALAIRLVEALSFFRLATWRLAIAALAKVQRELPRLRRAMEEAMGLQTLALGPLLAGFALLAPWVLPITFGEEWLPVLTVYPFVALSYLLNAVFNMHSSVLYVLRRNWSVTAFHMTHIALFAGAAFPLVERLGLIGYGLAEVVAVSAYLVIHLRVSRLFDLSYKRALPWVVAFVPPLFLPLVPLPWGVGLWIFALFAGLSAPALAQIREYSTYVRRLV